MRGAGRTTTDTGGFTLVEMLVVMLVAIVLLGAAYQAFGSQARLSSVASQTLDARESVRAGAALLAWDLRSISAEDGDLELVDPDSVVIRSARASGVVCSTLTRADGLRVGLQHSSGNFEVSSGDSVIIHTGPDNPWELFAATAEWTGSSAWAAAPAGGGTPVCFWADSTTAGPRPEATLHLTGDSISLAAIGVGSPVVLARRSTYGLFQDDGRWWLGVRDGAGAFGVLAGPMVGPDDGGLVFEYRDAAGAVTADPAQVSSIRVRLISESHESIENNPMLDTLSTTVYLRNNGAP